VDALRLAAAQAELIAAELVDARVAERRSAQHQDGRPGHETEVEQALANGVSCANVGDQTAPAHGQGRQRDGFGVGVRSPVVHEIEIRFHE